MPEIPNQQNMVQYSTEPVLSMEVLTCRPFFSRLCQEALQSFLVLRGTLGYLGGQGKPCVTQLLCLQRAPCQGALEERWRFAQLGRSQAGPVWRLAAHQLHHALQTQQTRRGCLSVRCYHREPRHDHQSHRQTQCSRYVDALYISKGKLSEEFIWRDLGVAVIPLLGSMRGYACLRLSLLASSLWRSSEHLH